MDLILSSKLQNLSIRQHKNSLHSYFCHHKQLGPFCVTQNLIILMLDTYCNLVWIDTWTFLTLSIFLALDWLDTWVTRHSLQLGIYTYYTWHILLAQHELSKYLKCVDTQLSKPIWDQYEDAKVFIHNLKENIDEL